MRMLKHGITEANPVGYLDFPLVEAWGPEAAVNGPRVSRPQIRFFHANGLKARWEVREVMT